MAGSIVIADNQVRVKDCYASAPIIDLTLRSNGEERVMVMDALGQFILAGFEAPTIAAFTTVVVALAPGMTNPKWVAYRYVYAATKRYPLVENAVTGGGKLSPRSNPSPSGPTALANITVANRGVNVTVQNSTRQDITEIWIYRTDYFDLQADAEQATAEGSLHFLASIPNPGITGTSIYQDRIVTVTGNELIEFDNFLPEQFALCVYADPYFYGFANFEFRAPISVTATGIVTLLNPWSTLNPTGDKWYDGRNYQIVTMEGITNGGFDGDGSYYFKWLTNTTAQLCFDLQLVQNGFVPYTGTTTISIKGPATNLYRSKPRNPFSWGYSTQIEELLIPQPYVHRVGGGQGTAICVVPILNLLKIDTEGPNRTYVFNLKAQGTEEFERSQQEISSDYSSSNHWCQFSAKTTEGASLIWFFDSKFNVICQTDGTSHREISSPVYNSIRNLSKVSNDRFFAHGVFDPYTQLSIIWTTRDVGTDTSIPYAQNDVALVYHHPSNTWSLLDQKGILCSTQYLDRLTNQQMVLIGTETGLIGRMFDPAYRWNWITYADLLYGSWPYAALQTNPFTITIDNSDVNPLAISINPIGLWMVFQVVGAVPTTPDGRFNKEVVGWARIATTNYVAGVLTVTFDRFYKYPGIVTLNFDAWAKNGDGTPYTFMVSLEAIVCNCCKVIDTETPSQAKTLAEVWVTKLDIEYPFRDTVFPSSIFGKIEVRYPDTHNYTNISKIFDFNVETIPNLEEPNVLVNSNNLWAKAPIPLDQIKNVTLSIFDVGYQAAEITNIQHVIKQR